MAVTYPLFAFEKNDQSMKLVEDSSRILFHMEAIDIENGEYVFWDANGNGESVVVSVTAFKSKLTDVTSCAALFPLRGAFAPHAKALGLSEINVDGPPDEVWRRFQREIGARPKKRTLLSRIFR
jgi:hypothetical protein